MISYLAIAGILCTFGYGYVLIPQSCTQPGVSGHVYIIWEYTPAATVGFLGRKYKIVGSSETPPAKRINKEQSNKTVKEIARYPVTHCLSAMGDVLHSIQLFGYNEFLEHDQSFLVLDGLFDRFLYAIETSIERWVHVGIPFTNCEHKLGNIQILFMHFAKGNALPFNCVWIYTSSDTVPDLMNSIKLIKLPYHALKDSHIASYVVTDCHDAADRLTELFVQHPKSYLNEFNLYGIPCLSPTLDFLHYKYAIEIEIGQYIVISYT